MFDPEKVERATWFWSNGKGCTQHLEAVNYSDYRQVLELYRKAQAKIEEQAAIIDSMALQVS